MHFPCTPALSGHQDLSPSRTRQNTAVRKEQKSGASPKTHTRASSQANGRHRSVSGSGSRRLFGSNHSTTQRHRQAGDGISALGLGWITPANGFGREGDDEERGRAKAKVFPGADVCIKEPVQLSQLHERDRFIISPALRVFRLFSPANSP